MKCKEAISIYSPEIREKLSSVFNSSEYDGMLAKKDVSDLMELFGVSEEKLMLKMLDAAETYSTAPISNFQVGAVTKGKSGNFYFGANQEFPGETLAFCVHAEPAAIVNALSHGEKGITAIAVTYIPCYLCRQFMLELPNAADLRVILPEEFYFLSGMTPHPFSPSDLKKNASLMEEKDNGLMKNNAGCAGDKVVFAALTEANKSYSLYTKSYSGVAFLTDDGRIFTGRYVESVAFNISMNPMMAAISNLNMSNLTVKNIIRAVIAEPAGNIVSQIKSAENLLFAVNPKIKLEVILI